MSCVMKTLYSNEYKHVQVRLCGGLCVRERGRQVTPPCVAQTRAKEPAFLVQVLSLCRKLELARYAARSRA